jgi:phosphohistidine phosphatase
MRLYFMRHADALSADEWRGEEAARPLTEKGRTQAAAVGAGLARLRPGVRAVIASPYARAYETAVIVGKALGLPVESSDELTPGFDVPRLDRALALRPDVDGALLVGHEPDLSELITTLTRHAGEHAPHVAMKKASVCLITTPADLPGGASAAELVGVCDLGWLRTWRELELV